MNIAIAFDILAIVLINRFAGMVALNFLIPTRYLDGWNAWLDEAPREWMRDAVFHLWPLMLAFYWLAYVRERTRRA